MLIAILPMKIFIPCMLASVVFAVVSSCNILSAQTIWYSDSDSNNAGLWSEEVNGIRGTAPSEAALQLNDVADEVTRTVTSNSPSQGVISLSFTHSTADATNVLLLDGTPLNVNDVVFGLFDFGGETGTSDAFELTGGDFSGSHEGPLLSENEANFSLDYATGMLMVIPEPSIVFILSIGLMIILFKVSALRRRMGGR